jgi:hypothetical protein
MTYDELLVKINEAGINSFEVDSYAWIALRAVVELHKPDYEMCMTCELTEYPCLTIKTIEKALL